MMSKTQKLFTEALDPLNKIANSIIKKLNYIEMSLIKDAKDMEGIKSYLQKTAIYHSNSFDELPEEKQEIVLNKIWNTVHKILGQEPVEESQSTEELEQKIYDFLKSNGGILYPLETSAKKLAQVITKKD